MAPVLTGLDRLINDLEKIQTECGAGEQNKDQKVEKDEFLIVKEQAYKLLVIIREKIKHRLKILKERGNNVETISLGVRIQTMIKDMENMFPKLHAIVVKQSSAGLLRKRLSPEDCETRYNDIGMLKRHLEEAKRAHLSNRDLDDGEVESAWQQTGDGGESGERRDLLGGAGVKVDETGREITEDEQKLIDRFEARDREFDNILNDISNEVDHLGEHATKIGESAERQGEMINKLKNQVDDANEGVKDLNAKVKDIMENDSNSSFCTRIILILVLMALIGLVLNKVTSYI